MKNFSFNSLFSTNYKDIGTLYFFFGAFSGIIGTLFSVIMRMELVSPGDPILNGNFQFYSALVITLTFASGLFFLLSNYKLKFQENDEANLAFALVLLFFFAIICRIEQNFINSDLYLVIPFLKVTVLLFPMTLTLKIITEGFLFKYKLILFLISYNILLLSASGENHLFLCNMFLTVIYFNCRYFMELPEYKISVNFILVIFILACWTAVFNSISLALVNLAFGTALTKKKNLTFLDELTLLTKVGLPPILDIISKTFVRTANILFKDLEQRPKLTTALFLISGASLGYVNAKAFDFAAIKSMYFYDLLQIYNINKGIENAKVSYLFFKEQNLTDLLNSTIEELKSLQEKKVELERKTLDHKYIGPVSETRAILRANAYGLLEIARTRSYNNTTFTLLDRFDDFDS
jgi:hypothetical protein